MGGYPEFVVADGIRKDMFHKAVYRGKHGVQRYHESICLCFRGECVP
jgi:hypothetical protein